MYVAGSRAKGAVAFCAPVNLRLRPWDKPHPPNMLKIEPMKAFMPLMDVYAGGDVRRRALEDKRLHRVLRGIQEVPLDILHVVPGIDVLVEEQRDFVDRVRKDFERGK